MPAWPGSSGIWLYRSPLLGNRAISTSCAAPGARSHSTPSTALPDAPRHREWTSCARCNRVSTRCAGRNGSPSSWWVMVQSEGPSTALCFHLGGGGGPRRRFLRRTARRIMPVPRRRRRRGRAAQQISAVGPGGVRGSDPPGGVTGVQGAVSSLGSETSVSCPPVGARPGRLFGPHGRVQPVPPHPLPRGPLGGGSDGRPKDDRVSWIRPGAAMPRARVPMGWKSMQAGEGEDAGRPGRTAWAHRCSAGRRPRRPVRHNDRLRSGLEGPGR